MLHCTSTSEPHRNSFLDKLSVYLMYDCVFAVSFSSLFDFGVSLFALSVCCSGKCWMRRLNSRRSMKNSRYGFFTLSGILHYTEKCTSKLGFFLLLQVELRAMREAAQWRKLQG